MTMTEFEAEVLRTAAFNLGANEVAVLALGVAGEAGEVCDLVKKHFGQGHDLNRDKLVEELGDVLWYVTALAARLGYPLREVAERNVAKLKARYPSGFDAARSVNR